MSTNASRDGPQPSTLFDRARVNNWAVLDLLAGLSDRLPTSCRLCGARSRGIGLCEGCLGDLPWVGRPPWQAGIRGIDHVWAAFYYRYPIPQLIHAAKFQRDTGAVHDLSRLVARVSPAPGSKPDLLVPVPLHPRRLIGRGFNQAAELARPLATRLGSSVATGAINRIGAGPPQATLGATLRRRNLRGVFRARRALDGCHIVVVDDVLTTGATAAAVADALRARGAERVDLWVCALA